MALYYELSVFKDVYRLTLKLFELQLFVFENHLDNYYYTVSSFMETENNKTSKSLQFVKEIAEQHQIKNMIA